MQERLVELYPIIQEVCKGITKKEDLAHDTLIRLDRYERLNEVPDDMIRHFIYQVAKNIFLNQIKRDRYCTLLIELESTEDEELVDPYEYILKIRDSNLDEIERLWIETYLDAGTSLESYQGVYTEISKKINVSRQTITKKIKQACKKLRN